MKYILEYLCDRAELALRIESNNITYHALWDINQLAAAGSSLRIIIGMYKRSLQIRIELQGN